MDDDFAEDLEVQKKYIEAEIRRRKRALAKAQQVEAERMLIEAAEGKVSFRYRITTAKFCLQGQEKRRKRHSKMPVSTCHPQSLHPIKT